MPAKSATPVLTVDGPSGAGKGTVSRLLAARSGWHLLDSGALYRLVAPAGGGGDLAAQDEAGHTTLAQGLLVEFGSNAAGEERILLAGRDVTGRLRSAQAGLGASRV